MHVTEIMVLIKRIMEENIKMMRCPCGSENEYGACCGQWIDQGLNPPTPEALMRSRYTAYALARIDYIANTMCQKAAIGFNAAEAECWAKRVRWLGLDVRNVGHITPDQGWVEFIAHYQDNGTPQFIHELSEFHRINGKWFYVDGKRPSKPQRNAPCFCNSGKKYKHCHGR